MTKSEVVEWLLKNGFEQRGKEKIRFYRTYRGGYGITLEEQITIRDGLMGHSDDGEVFYFCRLANVRLDEHGWLTSYNFGVQPREAKA